MPPPGRTERVGGSHHFGDYVDILTMIEVEYGVEKAKEGNDEIL
jgi:hypothetical protein